MHASHDTEFYFLPSNGDMQLAEQIASAIGTKDHPVTYQGYKMHLDGVFAEVAPVEPYGVSRAHLSHARSALEEVLSWDVMPVNFVDLRQLMSFDRETCPNLLTSAMTSGCSPDFVRGKQRVIPPNVKRSMIREAGIHFHFDLPEQYWGNVQMCGGFAYEVAQATQLQHLVSLGEVPPGYRPWYRVPGVYRAKPYGIEYRSFGVELLNHEAEYDYVLNVFERLQREAFYHAQREVFL